MEKKREDVQQPGKQNQQTTEESSYKTYALLRGMLDSIEIMSVMHYAKARTAAERRQRADELEKILKPVVRQLSNISRSDGNCPPGLKDCGGCCVPYDCTIFENF